VKKTLSLLVLGLCLFLTVPAQADFWEDYQLRLEAEQGELELVDEHIDLDGVYAAHAWWFNGTKGLISRLVVSQDVFFLHPYHIFTGANQPWLHEYIPALSHEFISTRKVGELDVQKTYTWWEGTVMWRYHISHYYQRHEGKSFFRLHQGSTWVFWIIDPLAEEETTL
jgi:hypothetical protein